jgi:hypothetical protein
MLCELQVVPTLIRLSVFAIRHLVCMTNDPRHLAGVKSRQITVVNHRLIH